MTVVALAFGLLSLSVAALRSSASEIPDAQSVKVTAWEVAAGGKMEFDVASVKQAQSSGINNFPLDAADGYTPDAEHGLFSATGAPLNTFISFAYKLNQYQNQAVRSQLPKWATANRYEIQARSEHNPTKDQMRLM